MLSRLVLSAVVFVVQPPTAALCAVDCEIGDTLETKSRPAQHCAEAASRLLGESEAHHPNTKRPTPSSPDGSDCEDGHRVCVAFDNAGAELNAPPPRMLALEPPPIASLSNQVRWSDTMSSRRRARRTPPLAP